MSIGYTVFWIAKGLGFEGFVRDKSVPEIDRRTKLMFPNISYQHSTGLYCGMDVVLLILQK